MATNALEIINSRDFKEAARKVFANPKMRIGFMQTVGFEIEYSVLRKGTTELTDQETRDRIIAEAPDLLDQELGAGQIEVKGQPVDLSENGFAGLEKYLVDCEMHVAQAAANNGAEIFRGGSFPVQRVDRIQRTQADRYNRIPNWHNIHHSPVTPTSIGAANPTRPATADIIGLMNSVQFNFAVSSPEEAIKRMNISFAILSQIIAVSGNSRFLDYVDTHFSDTRMIVWERTHDTRSPIERITNAPLRVGLPNSYFRDLEDYIDYLASFPFILDKPDSVFAVGMGLNWSDARLKIKDKILLEFRPVSVQPSIAEDVAVCAFYLGLLEYHCAQKTSLPPMSLNKLNRHMAMRYGLKAEFAELDSNGTESNVPASKVILDGLDKAKQGLIFAGFEDGLEYLSILKQRVLSMNAPSDDFARTVEQMLSQGFTFNDALKQAVRNCVVKVQ